MINLSFPGRSAIVSVILVTLVIAGCSPTKPSMPEPQKPVEENALSPFVKGIVTVRFDEQTAERVEKALAEGVSPATRAPQLGGIFEEMGIRSLRRVFPDAGEFEPRTRREGLHRFYYVEFNDTIPATRAVRDLKDIPGIQSVTPQLPVKLRAFNDPYFSSQWHFVNTRYKGYDINVQKVWDEFTVGRSDVIVSVVDEGVLLTHEDLAANVVPGYEDGTGSYNFNNDTPTVVPTQGHGTHVAGIIAAVSNNGIGVAGIAGGDAANGIPGVKVMSCQIFDLFGNQPDIYQAIKHGADHGAVILQCSWGFSPDLDGDGFTSDAEIELYRSFTINDLPEYKAAIDYFIKYAGCDNKGNQLPGSPMKGGVVIFASGNDNFDFDPLVSYEPIIAVGAFGATGNKASYSNYGDWIDIAAPGGDGKLGIYSTLLSNTYGGTEWMGTSMACPHVSGVAALLVSHFGGPGFTAEECRTRIIRGAVANAFSGTRYIGRKLDAYGAFTFDLNTPILPPTLAWNGETPAEISHSSVATIPFTASDPAGQRLFFTLSPELPGISVNPEGTALLIDGSRLDKKPYSVTLTVANEDHLQASVDFRFTVVNFAPEALPGLPEGILLEAPGKESSIKLADFFKDPDGDALTFAATTMDPSLVSVEMAPDGTATVKALRAGISELVLTASDDLQTARAAVPIAVVNPASPVWLYPTVADASLYFAVGSAEPADIDIRIYSYTGAEVLSLKEMATAFHPVRMDIGKLPPGTYTARVTYRGEKLSLRFSKK